ncbi:MAG: tyrosine-protein phosphatase [Dysgonamonadaceae bacterium]|jgi:protein-tyrosine phosphatase|nr:tyrosine-protein phosphatase [Dysgonamonadaceae bacterium]
MSKKVLFLFLYLTLVIGCTSEEPKISAACELMPNGTYLIKWETFPPMEGRVKVYESNRPDSFDLTYPVFEQNIQTGYRSVLSSMLLRPYFKLVFNRKYSTIVSGRTVPTQGIFNFRDLGGYYTRDNRQIRWGKIYRSGSLGMATGYDRRILAGLHLKTLIDFRTEQESFYYPNKFKTPQVYNLPLRGNGHDIFFDEILSRKMHLTDILDYDRDVFSFMLENNTDYFIRMFDVLLDEKNYPVVISCFLGKDRTAIASALILAALDVKEETIYEDYLLSNTLIDYHALVRNADSYTFDIQQAITALYSAHTETIRHAFAVIRTNYGSIHNYMEKELHLTTKKREKLKSILLDDAL